MPLIGNETKLGSVRGTGMAILAGRVRYSLNAPGGEGVGREREKERNKKEEMLKFNMHACMCMCTFRSRIYSWYIVYSDTIDTRTVKVLTTVPKKIIQNCAWRFQFKSAIFLYL